MKDCQGKEFGVGERLRCVQDVPHVERSDIVCRAVVDNDVALMEHVHLLGRFKINQEALDESFWGVLNED